jgi:hypothetical protein
VAIPLDDFAKPMVVALPRDGDAGGNHVAILDEELPERADIIPKRLERFDVRLARGRQHFTVWRAAVAVLVGEPDR